MKRPVYWVCVDGFIWTLTADGRTDYKHYKAHLDNDRVVLLAEDGEEIDQFVAWTSLSELATTLEGHPT